MIIECGVKTVTEVAKDKVTISTTCCEVAEKPTIFRADLLTEVKTINKTKGREGELLFTHTDEEINRIGEINNKGELIISPENDNSENYSINSNGELIYAPDE